MAVRESLAKLYDLATKRTGTGATGATASYPREHAREYAATGDVIALPSRFRLRHELGQGGMGIVYRVYDAELGHDVALKSLHHLDADEVYYLKSEFRALTGIVHPNLIEFYELFAAEAACFFTMELIAGSDLLSYTRPPTDAGQTCCDFDRLRDSARQLALALRAVHAAGKLHRDVKPSNVMVTRTGRVVLLDFGVVAPMRRGQNKTAGDGFLVGTLDYMAPEQARGEPLTAAADWYGFGATLYEAVAGRRLSERTLGQLLRTRADDEPPRLAPHAPDAPPDLVALIEALLSPAQAARPDGAQIIERLSPRGAQGQAGQIAFSSPAETRDVFQNRAREQASLLAAFERLQNGSSGIVHLHGPSGIGKSELARQFNDRARARGAVVLEGRCHPQESVAFNALDGMVDALSQELEGRADERLTEAALSDADALSKLFPVLARVASIARSATEARGEQGLETVQRGGRALKALLHALSMRAPLVIWLDDVQWGDEDSGKLLRELIHPPDAPRVLLLLSYRTEDRATSGTLNALAGAEASELLASALDLSVEPLSDADILALVENSAGAEIAAECELSRFAAQAAGYPFLAHEISRYLLQLPANERAFDERFQLNDILALRLERLSVVARHVVEVVAVAGGPLDQLLILRAAGLDHSARPVLRHLESLQFVRSATLGPERRTEIYHHRIRDGVIALLDDATRRARHRSIAEVMLTAPSPMLPQIVDHFVAAEERESVRRYAASAARGAAEAFAFERAAGLYELAIEYGSWELSAVELYERLADALANAGHGRDAGNAFERAAELGAAAGATEDYLLSLRKRAAEQFLKSWQRAEATRALNAVLEPLGIALPRSRSAALLETLANRVRIARLQRRKGVPVQRVPPHITDRLDVLLTLNKVYTMVDHTYGIAFGARLLRDALQHGQIRYIQYGLACECASWSALRGAIARRAADGHLAQLERIGREHGDAYIRSVIRTCSGVKHHFRGEFAAAIPHLEAGIAGLRGMRVGLTADLAVHTTFYLAALGFVGRLRDQAALLDAELLAAEARGDNYFLATSAAGHSSLAWLVSGRRAEAARWAERVLAVAPSGFSSQHYFHLTTMVLLDLHAGDGARASERIEAAWPAIRSNHYLSLSLIGDDLRHLRARAAIAVAVSLPPGRARKRALDIALQEARMLERHGLPFASAWAAQLRAAVAASQGQLTAAVALLRAALPTLDACQLALTAAVTRYALGQLSAAEAAAASSAERWMRDAGVVDVAAVVRLFLPGCAT